MIWLATAVATSLLVPVFVVVIESLLALLPRRNSRADNTCRPACVILIPAHNEEAGIAATVDSLRPQLRAGDRVIVIADNCSDATADVARRCGAEVIERRDAERRGKGFALNFAVRHLETDPPEVVVVLDADCRPEAGALDALATQVARTGRPAQAVYLLDVPADADPRRRISAFAWLVKNRVRPLGLTRLGLPCLLNGSGMAFPWEAIRSAPLAHGNIVEDMQLGVDLALNGHAPRLCPGATVIGEVAPTVAAAAAQRTRWEHGHLRTLLTQVPRLLWASARECRPSLAALALELSVPPLTVLALIWAVALIAGCGWWAAGGPALPATILAVGGAAALLAGSAVWLKFGRAVATPASIAGLPVYVCWKLPIYVAFLASRQREWVRTERAAGASRTCDPARKGTRPSGV